MPSSHGTFVWYDVMTSDTKAAESFYHEVIGWDAKRAWDRRGWATSG
jgi:predicted enzyme related to lactoylglutathione lyase